MTYAKQIPSVHITSDVFFDFASHVHNSTCCKFSRNCLCQEGYVFVVVCLFVCLLPTLRENFRTDLHEIFREGWQWANEQTIKFWWRFGLISI